MKKIALIIIILSLFSCAENNSKDKEIITRKERRKIEYELLYKKQDSFCKSERKKAKKDIKKGKQIYFYTVGFCRSHKELEKILSNINIDMGEVLNSCLTPHEIENCYSKVMNNHIKEKFGKNFIDSLVKISDKKYVINNIDRTFRFDECDTISRVSHIINYREFLNMEKEYLKTFEYPNGYIEKEIKGSYSYTSADFIIHKNGTISDIEVETSFKINENYKYAAYFNRKFKEFILETKWISAKSAGIKVRSEMSAIIYYK